MHGHNAFGGLTDSPIICKQCYIDRKFRRIWRKDLVTDIDRVLIPSVSKGKSLKRNNSIYDARLEEIGVKKGSTNSPKGFDKFVYPEHLRGSSNPNEMFRNYIRIRCRRRNLED